MKLIVGLGNPEKNMIKQDIILVFLCLIIGQKNIQ